jgi:hypothetical protein
MTLQKWLEIFWSDTGIDSYSFREQAIFILTFAGMMILVFWVIIKIGEWRRR